MDIVHHSCQGHGALKVSCIDVTTPDSAVDSFLQNTIHKQACPEEIAKEIDSVKDLQVHDEPCLVGLCCSDPYYSHILKLVRVLSKQLDAHSIKTGALLHISATLCQTSHTFFLGVVVKKPFLQTLIVAQLEDGRAFFHLYDQSRLQVWSSHQLFLRMMRQAAQASSNSNMIFSSFKVSVDVWRWEPFLDAQNCLQVRAEDIASTFEISSLVQPNTATAKPKDSDSLPFGMALPKRTRKRKKGTKTKTDGSKPPSNHQGSQADSDSDAASFNPADYDSAGTSSESDWKDDTEPIEPISKTMEAETAALREVTKEIYQADSIKADAAGASSSSAVPATTFFSRELGLGAEHGPAASGRSRCHSCHSSIEKGSIRFQWWWNVRKPNAWLHPYCLLNAADNYNIRAQTITKLRLLSESANIASVQAAARSILDSVTQ